MTLNYILKYSNHGMNLFYLITKKILHNLLHIKICHSYFSLLQRFANIYMMYIIMCIMLQKSSFIIFLSPHLTENSGNLRG